MREGVVPDVDGEDIAIHADTLCVHGDGPNAAELARRLHAGLQAAGVEVSAPRAAKG